MDITNFSWEINILGLILIIVIQTSGDLEALTYLADERIDGIFIILEESPCFVHGKAKIVQHVGDNCFRKQL